MISYISRYLIKRKKSLYIYPLSCHFQCPLFLYIYVNFQLIPFFFLKAILYFLWYNSAADKSLSSCMSEIGFMSLLFSKTLFAGSRIPGQLFLLVCLSFSFFFKSKFQCFRQKSFCHSYLFLWYLCFLIGCL